MRLQNLEPVSARLCLRVEKILKERGGFRGGEKLLLAISGGADSIALALVLKILAPRLDLSLAAIHVNHHLRPEAGADAAFVAKFCGREQIPCKFADAEAAALAKTRRCGLEEAGRLARLKILEEQADIAGADYILTAHHAGDLAEDILMRLTRGAGWPALGGMAWKSGSFFRPLLEIEPCELRSFLVAAGQTWREDKSNQSLAFMRNRYRNVLLPLLRCENPSIDAALARTHEFARLDADYWEKELDSALAANPWQCSHNGNCVALLLPAALLKPLHPAARLRLYHRALNCLRGSGQNRADTLNRLEKAWQSGIGGKIIQCSGGITAHCGKDGVLLKKAGRE